MGDFLTFLAANQQGIVLLLVLLVAAAALVQWVAWVFGWGRFTVVEQPADRAKPLRHIFAELVVKIIDDFRHLLALVIVLIFAGALTFALFLVSYVDPTMRIDALSEALQAVVSALGGLIGAIIGYYFGEKAGEKCALAKAAAAKAPLPPPGPPAQEDHPAQGEPLLAPPPPGVVP